MGKPTTDFIWKNSNYLAAAAILLMVLVAYIPAMQGGYVWDDDKYVTENQLLTMPDGLSRIWFSLDSPSQYFPLVYTMFRMEHAVWGMKPLGYHVVNVLLHAMNALLLWWILRRLKVPGAWLAAAIWALHPVNVESVAWITERKNTLSTLFYMLSVLGWIRFVDDDKGRRWQFYGLALGAYMLALFAKTTACTIPAALLVILWIKREKIDWKRLAEMVPFVVLGLAMGLLSIWWEKHHQGTMGELFAYTLPERFLIAGHALWFYLGKLILPIKLTFSYPKWDINAHNPLQYGWLVACVAAALALWKTRTRIGDAPWVGMAFFAATLAPMLGFISLFTFRYTYVADHYQYVACIGPIVLFAAFIYGRCKSSAARYVVPAVILCVLGTMTWMQGRIYKDLETVWSDTLVKNPTSWLAHGGLGVVYDGYKLPEQAMEHYQAAMKLNPHHWEAYISMGALLDELGRPDEAVESYAKGLKYCPTNPNAYYGMANALAHAGRLSQAVEQYTASIQLDPSNPDSRCNLAVVYAQQGKLKEAADQLRAALKINPNLSEARDNLRAILDRQNQTKGQIAGPQDSAVSHYLNAVELQKQGKIDEAIHEYQAAIRIKPDYAEVYCNLGLAYASVQRVDEAIEACRKSIKLNPKFGEAHNNLAIAYYMKARYDEAWAEVNLSRKFGTEPNPDFIAALTKARGPGH